MDQKFHRKRYEASGYLSVARAWDEMYSLDCRRFYSALDRTGSVRANVEEHRDIVRALKAGHDRTAERLIQPSSNGEFL